MPSPSQARSQLNSAVKIPALLESHILKGPILERDSSLTVVTSIQGATANWLVLRYVYALLGLQRGLRDVSHDSLASKGEESDGDFGLVLVSFMRDCAFWKDGATRLGLDLDVLRKSKRFSFVDGLTGLFTGDNGSSTSRTADKVLRSCKLEDIKSQVLGALSQDLGVTVSKKVLVVDHLDALLAMGGDDIDGVAVQNMLFELREHTFSTVLTFSADMPLIHNQTTTLEKEHAALVLGLAHAADEVVSLRKLDTGAAGDVSGVLSISSSSSSSLFLPKSSTDAQGQGDDDAVRDVGASCSKELLYHVAGDGFVKVFERGT